ncbi:peritrophin-1 [Galendromus occidentalis]|uniref:Peritrophin-1 n=1 Tax=Galendromus occidentalis TaxID=34638 RepID=A0AAJ7P8X5_9ACAR|nr:peritrophin-1 [Galendromus occidentalis]
MFAVFVLSCCVLAHANGAPAFAGGLSMPVVPPMFSGFNPPAPSDHSSDTPSDPDCPPTDGTIPLYIPDPESCSKYTVCSGGFGLKLECAPGMHFNVATSSCTFPALAKCSL